MDLTRPTETMIRRLFELACTPFQVSLWRTRWSVYGWCFDSEPSEPDDFLVTLPEGIALRVSADGDRLTGASLPFCFWEDFSADDHQNAPEFFREKKEFDACLDDAADLASRVLPKPFLQWQDKDDRGHRAFAWKGTEGILILQQASVDPQFGIEVDFWLTANGGLEFSPRTPLIDYLTRRS